MPSFSLPGYYNRFDEADNYEEHLFRAGYLLQSAELNEIQSNLATRLRRIADGIYRDGDIVRDARIAVDQGTGDTTCESGAIYLAGAVRGVPDGTMTIPVTGSVIVGIYLQQSVVNESGDPDLRDPATGIRGYQEPGAARLKIEPVWGYLGDGQSGDFYQVYEVLDGIPKSKEAPPALDSVLQSIARYDRDSTGGVYVIGGFEVSDLGDSGANQVYNVAKGRARVWGQAVEFLASRRVVYSPAADLQLISNEPKTSSTSGAQRVNVNWSPISTLLSVSITAQKSVSIVHGAFTGASDPLPDTSIVSIVSVTQGATTYTDTTDYVLSSDSVSWAPIGAEPAPGSTYSVTYRYIKEAIADVTAADEEGFTISGAVSGTTIYVDYYFKLPRIDRMCLTPDGEIEIIRGIPHRSTPKAPTVPSNYLALATISQTWKSATKKMWNDGIRMVSMGELNKINDRLGMVFDLIAEQRLLTDASLRESILKKGAFVDPFTSDTMRDLGLTQTLAIVDGVLTLAIAGTPHAVSNDVAGWTTGAHTNEVVLQQVARTGSMKVNPYSTATTLPCMATLEPSMDRWTQTVTRTTTTTVTTHLAHSIQTRRWLIFPLFFLGLFGLVRRQSSTVVANTTVDVNVQQPQMPDAQYMRQLEVHFTVQGFGPSEVVSATFDGIPVTLST